MDVIKLPRRAHPGGGSCQSTAPGRNKDVNLRTQFLMHLRHAFFVAVTLGATASPLIAAPIGYTLTDLGTLPNSTTVDFYSIPSNLPIIFNDGQVILQGNPPLSNVYSGNAPQGRWFAALPGLDGSIQYLPYQGGDTLAVSGSSSFFVGAVQGVHPAAWSPQDGWQILPGLATFDEGIALGLNAERHIVGTSSSSYDFYAGFGPYHAFLYQNGTTIDLNQFVPSTSNLVLSAATGINDAGQIVGIAAVGGNVSILHAFELTPVATTVPEPATWAVFATLFAGCMAYKRLRGRTQPQ